MALITELDDQLLVEAHQSGDVHAFEQIVDRHHHGLLRHAYRRLADPSLAEDAVQETLLRAFRAMPRFQGDYRLDAWLHRILTNVCFDMGRRRGRDVRLFDKVSGTVEFTTPAIDDDIPADDPALVAALEALPDGYRDVLVMRLVDGLSYADVADRAGITEDNARARVSRGRSMLRTMLSGATSAVVWLIPPLRRNQVVATTPTADGAQVLGSASTQAAGLAPTVQAATPVVANAAPAASTAAPVVSSASSVFAQAAPALAQAAPAVQSSAPVLGKAAVAVGIAATVAIPAGKVVEERINAPEPAAAPADAEVAEVAEPGAPVEVDATPAPAPTSGSATIAGDDVEATAGDEPVVFDATPTTSAPTSTATSAPAPTAAPSTTAAPAPAKPTPTTAPASTEPVAEEPPAGPPAEFLAEGLTVTEAGPRLEISGSFTLDTPDGPAAGTLAGKVLLGDADPKDPAAPRSFEGDLTLTLDDGTSFTLRFRGQAVVSEDGAVHDLSAVFRLPGAAALGLDEAGDLTGRFVRDGSAGGLRLTLPTPAPADEPTA